MTIMKLSWKSLKISIAGARLSHLVQKDKIWDHGTMVEFVKIVFYQLQKMKNGGDAEALKKYLTEQCREKLKDQMNRLQAAGKMRSTKNARIKEIAVINVMPATMKHPDIFKALVKGYEVYHIENWNSPAPSVKHDDMIHEFSEEWSFERQSDWWLLDEMKD